MYRLLLSLTLLMLLGTSMASAQNETRRTLSTEADSAMLERLVYIYAHVTHDDSVRALVGDTTRHLLSFVGEADSIAITVDQKASFRIYSLTTGEEVWRSSGRLNPARQRVVIPTGSLAPDVYMIIAYDYRGASIGYTTYGRK